MHAGFGVQFECVDGMLGCAEKSARGNKLLAGSTAFNGPELLSSESVASEWPSRSTLIRGQLAASHPLSGADETFTFSAVALRTLTVIFFG